MQSFHRVRSLPVPVYWRCFGRWPGAAKLFKLLGCMALLLQKAPSIEWAKIILTLRCTPVTSFDVHRMSKGLGLFLVKRSHWCVLHRGVCRISKYTRCAY